MREKFPSLLKQQRKKEQRHGGTHAGFAQRSGESRNSGPAGGGGERLVRSRPVRSDADGAIGLFPPAHRLGPMGALRRVLGPWSTARWLGPRSDSPAPRCMALRKKGLGHVHYVRSHVCMHMRARHDT